MTTDSDAADGFLGSADGQRRVGGNRLRQLAHRGVERIASAMRVTSPSETASVASISRAVKSRSLARAGPIGSTSRAQFAG